MPNLQKSVEGVNNLKNKKMKITIQVLILIIAIQLSIYAQNKRTLNLSGRLESIELIDSAKFNPYGFWRAFAYEEYNEDCNKPKVKDSEFALNFNKNSWGSISHFSKERVIGFGDTPIRSPTYNPKFVLSKEDFAKMACREGEDALLKTDGDFFRRFGKLYGLHIGCTNMADSFDENVPADLYILNNNLLMSTRAMNIVIYYERVVSEDVYCGYKKDNEGYNIVNEGKICNFLEFEYPNYTQNAFLEIELIGDWDWSKITLKNENKYFCEDKNQKWQGEQTLLKMGKVLNNDIIIKQKVIKIPLNILLTKQLKYSVEGASKKDKKLNNRIIRFKINDTLSLKSNGKIIIDQSPVSDKLPFNTPVVYLNKNDEIIILEKVQHWYRIEYKNGNKKLNGWISTKAVTIN